MSKAHVRHVRPVSWKIFVAGEKEAEYVQGVLAGLRIDSTACQQEADIADPPTFSFVASPRGESTLTSEELQVILERNERIEVAFDALKSDR